MADDAGTTDATTDGGNDQQHSGDNAQRRNDDGFRPIASQAELDAILDKRISRERAKFKDYDSLKERASQYDALAAASQTDAERAASEASMKARQETLSTTVPRLVRAEFKAAAKGVLSADQLSALLEDLDLSKYANEDGEVDEERISKKVAALAPKEGERKQQFPDLGAGQRGGTAKNQNMNDLIRRAAGFAG